MEYIYVTSRADMVLDATTSRTMCLEFACEYLMINMQVGDYGPFIKDMTQKLRQLCENPGRDCGCAMYSHASGITLKFTVIRQE